MKQGLSNRRLKKAPKYAESCSWMLLVKISLTNLQKATAATLQATSPGPALGCLSLVAGCPHFSPWLEKPWEDLHPTQCPQRGLSRRSSFSHVTIQDFTGNKMGTAFPPSIKNKFIKASHSD